MKPKLVISDKEMSKLNGNALLDSLKRIPEIRMIPIILISASNNPAEEAMAYEKGSFDYIKRPLVEIIFTAKVRKALRANDHLLAKQF